MVVTCRKNLIKTILSHFKNNNVLINYNEGILKKKLNINTLTFKNTN